MSEFSEYIVYVDESGDHGLVGIDPQVRVFALRQLRPTQSNRAVDVIWPKIEDLKCFP